MKNTLIILSQSPQNNKNENSSHQLLIPLNSRKPQISSIPGISPKERNRYRVVIGEQILGERLTLDEAVSLAKRGAA